MKTKIFITPWIDLTDEAINSCVKAGANSARIHSGKLDSKRILGLIKFYNSINFKFYLDLRGNKAQTLSECEVYVNDEITFYTKNAIANVQGKSIEMNFIPQILNKYPKGDFTIDDGKIVFDFKEFVIRSNNEIIAIKTKVTRADSSSIYLGDGISSISLPIHSYEIHPFTDFDINILNSIPAKIRNTLKYIVVSFAENKNQLSTAKNILKKLNYSNTQVVPKVETVEGMKNIVEILTWLSDEYGDNAEFQIGRGDLTLDCNRYIPKVDIDKIIDNVILTANQLGVKVSVLAMIMQSLRYRMKSNPLNVDFSLSLDEEAYIKKLIKLGVYQIGLTNEMYIDSPEIMIRELKKRIDN